MSWLDVGSWHDIRVAEPLFELLESNFTPDPYHIIADSGFQSQTYKVISGWGLSHVMMLYM